MTLRVLYVTSEATPLAQTGGLGEVSGSLPPALRRLGVDVRLLLPAYPGVIARVHAEAITEPFKVWPGVAPVQLFQGRLPGSPVPIYLLHCPMLYERDGGLYTDSSGQEWPDNALRFAVLSKVAALLGRRQGVAYLQTVSPWYADILHCNDWQTGLTAAYVAHDMDATARTLMSIHNLAFQGSFPPSVLPTIGLPDACFQTQGVEFYGRVSFLKAGLYYADQLSTVSPTYAQEIQTPEYGCGLHGLLAHRRRHLTGILNGIDRSQWNPQIDPLIPARFSIRKPLGKAVNKQIVQERLGLKAESSMALLAVVSRLTVQKGIDLILAMAERLLEQPAQLVVLGNGEPSYELQWRRLARDYPQQVSVNLHFETEWAHLLLAAADMLLMPSRFEPCGLTQLYALAYRTVPIVRRTGGLADSVVDTTPRTLSDGTATGFVFDTAQAESLWACTLRALLAFGDRKTWSKIQNQGMRTPCGWDTCASRYVELYQTLVPLADVRTARTLKALPPPPAASPTSAPTASPSAATMSAIASHTRPPKSRSPTIPATSPAVSDASTPPSIATTVATSDEASPETKLSTKGSTSRHKRPATSLTPDVPPSLHAQSDGPPDEEYLESL